MKAQREALDTIMGMAKKAIKKKHGAKKPEDDDAMSADEESPEEEAMESPEEEMAEDEGDEKPKKKLPPFMKRK